jgi:hypothetical protein
MEIDGERPTGTSKRGPERPTLEFRERRARPSDVAVRVPSPERRTSGQEARRESATDRRSARVTGVALLSGPAPVPTVQTSFALRTVPTSEDQRGRRPGQGCPPVANPGPVDPRPPRTPPRRRPSCATGQRRPRDAADRRQRRTVVGTVLGGVEPGTGGGPRRGRHDPWVRGRIPGGSRRDRPVDRGDGRAPRDVVGAGRTRARSTAFRRRR